jgi:hypothetical protein
MPTIGEREKVTFKGMDGKTTIPAKVDTGAARTTIDHKIAARIGGGPVTTSVKVNGEDRRSVVKVWVELNGVEKLMEVSLSDRENKTTQALLGKPYLKHFKIELEA